MVIKAKTKVKVVRRYQGREVRVHIKANTLSELNRMITGMRKYAQAHKLGAIQVLRKHKDPDGGYEATIVAHNWNPLKWVAEKWEARGGGYEARLAKARERERRRLNKLELLEAKARRKERKLLVKAALEEARARREEAKLRRQAAISARKKARAAHPSKMVRTLRSL